MIQQYTIGRGDSCQIRIQDAAQRISRNHATLKVLDNGKIFITDHSSNGTWVNGVKISPNVDYPVRRGDSISFANAAELNWTLIPKKTNRQLIYILAGGIIIVIAMAVTCLMIFRPAVHPVEGPANHQPADSIRLSPETSQKGDTIPMPESGTEHPEEQPDKERSDQAKKDRNIRKNQPGSEKTDTTKTVIYY